MYNYFTSGDKRQVSDMITNKFNPEQNHQNNPKIEFLSPNYLYRDNVPKIGEGFKKNYFEYEWMTTFE